jgi:homoaconitase/3-isopropylmalate dehydratase large subunit
MSDAIPRMKRLERVTVKDVSIEADATAGLVKISVEPFTTLYLTADEAYDLAMAITVAAEVAVKER